MGSHMCGKGVGRSTPGLVRQVRPAAQSDPLIQSDLASDPVRSDIRSSQIRHQVRPDPVSLPAGSTLFAPPSMPALSHALHAPPQPCVSLRPLPHCPAHTSPSPVRLKASLSQALAARTDIPAFDTDTPAEKTLKMLEKLMHSEEVGGSWGEAGWKLGEI